MSRKTIKKNLSMKPREEKIKIILRRIDKFHSEFPQLVEDLELVKNEVTKEVIKSHIEEMMDDFEYLKKMLNKLTKKAGVR
jgi:hypothetical protein